MPNFDKFNRTKRFKKNIINGISEPDMLTNSFKDFKFSRQKNFYTLTSSDVARPDLLSLKFYDKMNYWWLVLKINKIEDVWNDLTPGDVFILPHKKDIEEFIMRNK